jgi:hypothetical protein
MVYRDELEAAVQRAEILQATLDEERAAAKSLEARLAGANAELAGANAELTRANAQLNLANAEIVRRGGAPAPSPPPPSPPLSISPTNRVIVRVTMTLAIVALVVIAVAASSSESLGLQASPLSLFGGMYVGAWLRNNGSTRQCLFAVFIGAVCIGLGPLILMNVWLSL